ncbi:signal peptide peptidase SppA [Pontixanthobacter aestiaquae]|uniref:Signal peptide peptidase SppA n=1 Tax=Pontixanthobacter aestiaquae TaxID=1509367 RepID=A0A844Z531_9SPHN|nr:signal peptide peptidase SppA [Pontixanthobacter aestiaquae]MDN3646160.1 signal peptide peptidase SppA [Pontixanthobacter aestiaquae]MXO82848.1 signal peptide peptidase SppA [Pontixanthobacter aestiaquae]
MAFAGKVWRLLRGIKDFLALIFLLLFFWMLFAILTARPSAALVQEGALLLELDGVIVEERTEVDPLQAFLSGQAPMAEFQVRDVVHALNSAATDERIKAVVLDLTSFVGGGHVHMQTIGEALDRVKAANKPVLTYAIGYGDDAMMLAAHSSEVWVDPLGGAVIAGPGGSRLYYGELLENLNINARVYKVGTYKSAVEPYSRSDMSPEARENYQQLFGSLWEEWQANVKKARPDIDLDLVTKTPAEWVQANQGDLAQAALAAGMVDKLGNKVEFGERVAELAGEDEWDEAPGTFAYTELGAWLADNPVDTEGDAIGVVTIAGEIVDGDAGPGTAGGDRIAGLLDDALNEDFKALVVRVDSPGGSVLASEEIRRAILRHKAKDIPIVVSMANVAASGGYWVSTPADRIFAEPESITGSIGIFAVIPTFEDAAAEWGVNGDGVRTTPLSGQPDLISGFTPEVDALLQATIEDGYNDFLTRVAEARGKSMEEIDAIGQGRVWDGGTARQIGLVDQYGGIEDALAYAAGKAGLEEGAWHAQYLGDGPDQYSTLLRSLLMDDDAESARTGGDLFAMVTGRQQALIGQAHSDLDRLLSVRGMQAYCLECPVSPAASRSTAPPSGWLAKAMAIFAD